MCFEGMALSRKVCRGRGLRAAASLGSRDILIDENRRKEAMRRLFMKLIVLECLGRFDVMLLHVSMSALIDHSEFAGKTRGPVCGFL
jgi:hypothetical protein